MDRRKFRWASRCCRCLSEREITAKAGAGAAKMADVSLMAVETRAPVKAAAEAAVEKFARFY